MSFLVIYMLFIGVVLLGALVEYLLLGFGMYKLGKAQGRSNAWLAFVPFAKTYFQGELGGPIHFKNKTLKEPGIWMVVMPIVAGVVTGIFYFVCVMVCVIASIDFAEIDQYGMMGAVSGIISIIIVLFIVFIVFAIIYQAALQVLYVLVNRQIYSRYTDDTMAIVHAVLGTVIPLYMPICMFIFGRRAEKEIEEKQMREMQKNSQNPYQE